MNFFCRLVFIGLVSFSGAVSMYISFSIDTGTGIRYDYLSTYHENGPNWTIFVCEPFHDITKLQIVLSFPT